MFEMSKIIYFSNLNNSISFPITTTTDGLFRSVVHINIVPRDVIPCLLLPLQQLRHLHPRTLLDVLDGRFRKVAVDALKLTVIGVRIVRELDAEMDCHS